MNYKTIKMKNVIIICTITLGLSLYGGTVIHDREMIKKNAEQKVKNEMIGELDNFIKEIVRREEIRKFGEIEIPSKMYRDIRNLCINKNEPLRLLFDSLYRVDNKIDYNDLELINRLIKKQYGIF